MKKISPKIAVMLSIIMLFAVFASACSFGFLRVNVTSIKFVKDSIEMEVGQEKDMALGTDVVINPSMASNKGFKITSDNEAALKVSSTNRLIAKASGFVTLTVTSAEGEHTDTMRVIVNYPQASAISIKSIGSVIQTLDNITSVEFTVSSDKTIDPTTNVEWSVNEQVISTLKLDVPFIFTPQIAGSFDIAARVEGQGENLFATKNISIYVPFENAPVMNFNASDLLQEADNFHAVAFDVAYTNSELNPSAKVQWFVNDKLTAADSNNFSFTPTVAGKFVVSCYVNGQIALSTGAATGATVIARGTVVPSNVRLDYDNDFPNVYVRWNEISAPVGYQISIVNTATNMEVTSYEISTRNSQTKPLFGKNSFNATSFINDASGANIFKNTFKISVKTLSDEEGIFSESDYSAAITTPLINSGAKSYLEKKYLGNNKNHYITSDEEFYEIYKYTLLWRGNSTISTKVFMAYKFGDENQLIDSAFLYAGITGSYNISVAVSDFVLTYGVTFQTTNVPTQKTSNISKQGWNTTIPHINYDKTKVRAVDYVFPIDRISRTVSVSNTEQLYYVAEKGYRPVPLPSSAAEKYYNYAREVLRNIITDDMTEVEKAHAIYDWVMWRVSYDHAVLDYEELSESVKFKSYYLEGVFDDNYPFAVCDGMAKAYALMANIEGLPCIRVVGEAKTSSGTGGHAWNKVLVEGQWYIVDCTWGDELISYKTTTAEIAAHKYFMLTDAEIASSHFEDYPFLYPRTSLEKYNWYNTKHEYENSKVDFYLASSGKALEDECNMLVDYLISICPTYNQAAYFEYYVGSIRAGNWTKTIYFSVDLRMHASNVSLLTSTYNNPLIKAFSSAGWTYGTNYSYLSDGEYLFIFMNIPKR